MDRRIDSRALGKVEGALGRERTILSSLGYFVNPIAGMGGTVGLKGTDGVATLREALKKGARPVAPIKAREYLTPLLPHGRRFNLLTAPGIMGAEIAKSVGIAHQVVGRIGRKTSAEDTARLSRLMKKRGVDLLVFCGGDGTARDILRAVGPNLSVLGVPAGVKVYSSVFAISPEPPLRFLLGRNHDVDRV